MVKLSHLSIDKIKSGRAITKSQYVESGNYKFVNINELYKNYSIDVNFLPQIEIDNAENSLLKKGDILFVRVSVKEEGAVFTSCFLSDETNVIYSDNILKLSPNTELLNPQFAVYVLRMEEFRKKLVDISNRANLTSVNGANLSNFEIPLPPLETQNTLVEQIEKERAAVDACKTLITLFEAKIKTKIAEVWGKITLE
jgi:restriction endonuclease S subunit